MVPNDGRRSHFYLTHLPFPVVLFLPNVLPKLFTEQIQFFVARAAFLDLAAEGRQKLIDARSAQRVAQQPSGVRSNFLPVGTSPLAENGFCLRRNGYLQNHPLILPPAAFRSQKIKAIGAVRHPPTRFPRLARKEGLDMHN